MLIWLAAPDWDHDLQIAAQIISNQGLIVPGPILLCYGFMIVKEKIQITVSHTDITSIVGRYLLPTKNFIILSCTCQNLIKP